ncbi:MAG: D-alanyl-D-alanine carboxypeptidase [Chloroflexota bacterium]|nr:D-alanyl-D-alanine carboxypeptidase [Chloroflexota bacterium]
MRRSEAILLFLFVATAVGFLAVRSEAGTPPVAVPRVAIASAAAPAIGPATATPAPTPTPLPAYFSLNWLAAHPPSDVPSITAKGAIVVDTDTQQVMFARAVDDRRPPASIMKIVTAMVALDNLKPEQLVTVSPAAATVEPNHMGLSVGEQVPVKDLLYGLLLDSGNDAAEALAEAVPGGRATFLEKMNQTAVRLGLENSHFVDPSGLDDANYTTPYDMAVLADAALRGYPTIRTVVATKQVAIPSTPTHKWFGPINLNDLLWDYPGTYGMKVGFTDAAEYTIVLAGQKDGHNVMIVLLGSKRHFTEGRALFTWAYAHLPVADGAPVRRFAAAEPA